MKRTAIDRAWHLMVTLGPIIAIAIVLLATGLVPSAVAGLLCFYNEKVDIEVDGVVLERPRTPFSSKASPRPI